MPRSNDNKDTKKLTFTTSFDPELLRRLKVYCAANRLRINELLEKLVTDHLNKEGGDNGISN